MSFNRLKSTAILIGLLCVTSLCGTPTCFAATFAFATLADEEPARPNVLWLTTEDIGPQLACYGDTTASTPNLDAFAKRSMVYDIAWSTYPVCAPARTTIISGMYAAANGAGNMRSLAKLPADVKMFPQYFREAGYYCTNRSKEDYNLHKPGQVWDQSNKKATWTDPEKRGTDSSGKLRPFFAVFNEFRTHESKIRTRPHDPIVDPADVKLPPYWPDVPEFRQDFAQYYDNLQTMDGWFGQRLKELEASGEADNTIVIFYGDHGSGMPRHKRFAGDSGMRVPFIVHVPQKLQAKFAPKEYQAGGRSNRPVGFVDLAPTMLSILGVEPPAFMQGHAFLGPHETEAPKYAYGFRDRMDERPDFSRSIRDERYIYVRNFFPHVPAGQYINYQQQTPCTSTWFAMFQGGLLNEVQSHFWKNHPAEELYDLQTDPHETVNLVNNPAHATSLGRFRKELKENTLRIGDLGFVHEGRLQEVTVSGQRARRELVDDEAAFPISKIFAVADLVGRGAENESALIKESATSPNPTVRYWAAQAVLNSKETNAKLENDLGEMVDKWLADEAPEVSMTASEIVLSRGFGNKKLAQDVVARFSNLNEGNQFYAVTALNIADRRREEMGDAIDQVKQVPTRDVTVDRGGEYVAELINAIFGEE